MINLIRQEIIIYLTGLKLVGVEGDIHVESGGHPTTHLRTKILGNYE